ncbi:hypothetical protein H6F76_28165 [Leptolyngbya sp. FACHB-321]|uniref:hypothetical protein n=1 Tax=Leptolyngbya sp. FACHB-321 TaxID=2692807 RepID=UPI001682606B|nr:hypothetical protein [Leptolyngbya sp. FACHB-321]MBD2038832.1 hypothetical protein [Leptolyngbya sp. FACHB-321]
MNPTLTQIVEHPEFGYILAQAVAFAAMGTNDKTVNGFRKSNKLIEGEHFVRVPQRAGMPKIHWTVTGLQALAIALGTDRAKSFDSDLTQWLQAHKTAAPDRMVLQHQPRGAVPLMPAAAEADSETVSLEAKQPTPLNTTHTPRSQAAPERYSLAELEALRAIAQSERDEQMLTLLDQAISTIAANQPQSQSVARVVYVQPQKTINFSWYWQSGSHNNSSGSAEAFVGLILVTLTVIGVWLLAAAVVQNNRPVMQRSELNMPWEAHR